jgi:hypothetical protein
MSDSALPLSLVGPIAPPADEPADELHELSPWGQLGRALAQVETARPRPWAVEADVEGLDLRLVRRAAIPVTFDPWGADGKNPTPTWQLADTLLVGMAQLQKAVAAEKPFRWLVPPVPPEPSCAACITFGGWPMRLLGQWNKEAKRYVVLIEAAFEMRLVQTRAETQRPGPVFTGSFVR